MIVLGIPLVLGLLWNKWAGGAAGFIMGGAYYMASAGLYNGYYASASAPYHNFYGDPSVMFWIVYGVLVGYMAGALVNGSTNFKRMLGAGLTSISNSFIADGIHELQLVTGLQRWINQLWNIHQDAMAHGLWTTTSGAYTAGSIAYGFTLAFIPYIALGVIVPILAKVMTWYGLQPMRHQ